MFKKKDPFEAAAARAEAMSTSAFRRTAHHQARAEKYRKQGEVMNKLEQVTEIANEARKVALAAGASKKEAKAAGQAAAKAFLEA